MLVCVIALWVAHVTRYTRGECGFFHSFCARKSTFSCTQSFLVGRLKVSHFLDVIFWSLSEMSKDSLLLSIRLQNRQSQFYHTSQILLHYAMHYNMDVLHFQNSSTTLYAHDLSNDK
jgi:hypothetical protein